jgi:ABC-type Fe3+-hydroxamate transport system substrate-binding protein
MTTAREYTSARRLRCFARDRNRVPPMRGIQTRDDRGRALRWLEPPGRIVSLVPSDTYSLVRLGATTRLVGRTRYCVEPAAELAGVEIVGGTKDADVDRIVALAPDLVVANQEENTKRDIERLEQAGLRVLVSFPRRVAEGIAHLARLALVLGHKNEPGAPRELVASAYHALRAAEARRSELAPVPAFVPIWMDPLMTANHETFLSDVLELCGGSNVFASRDRRYPLAADIGGAAPLPPDRVGDRDTRYPRVTLEEVASRAPAIVLLPDEPHAFTEADAGAFRALEMPAAHRGQVVFCDGKDLMWYGARSVEGLERISALLDAAR